MANITKHDAVVRTLEIIKDNLFESRQVVIQWHREWKLSPPESQSVLHQCATMLLTSWQDAVKQHGEMKARQKLDHNVVEVSMSLFTQSLDLDWMTAINMDTMPNVATPEYQHID